MSDYPEVAARFARDTAAHQLVVLHDDGLYRHLRFTSRPHGGYGEYWYDLITWPGCLTIRGDMGDTYTFNRLTDMFEFFRGKRINPHYWSEKLDGGRRSAQEYSEEKLRQLVVEYFVDAVRSGIAPRGLGKAVREEILNSGDLYNEGLARDVLDQFEYGTTFVTSCLCDASGEFTDEGEALLWRRTHVRPNTAPHLPVVKRVEGFSFEAWEWDLHDYNWRFLWACYAIVWGIARYDRVRRYGLEKLAAPEAVAS